LELYNAFFANIPLCTFVWTVDQGMNIVVKNRKSLCQSSTLISNGTLTDAFSCTQMNEYNIEMHEKAFLGESQTYLSYERDASFLTTLIPDYQNKEVVFVHGCSWEVTHLERMIDCSRTAVDILKETHPDVASSVEKVYEDVPLVQLVLKLRGDK